MIQKTTIVITFILAHITQDLSEVNVVYNQLDIPPPEYILNYQSGWSCFLFTAEYHHHFNRLAQLGSRISPTIIKHGPSQI